MARRVRDYTKEYADRIARGRKGGLSPSQARGHPRKGEFSASVIRKRSTYSTEQKYDEVIRLVRGGKSVTAARQDMALSQTSFARLNAKFHSLERDKSGRYQLKLSHFSFIDAAGQLRERVPFAGSNAVIMHDYGDAYEQALMSNSSAPLKRFRKTVVSDANGRKHLLATDLNGIKKALKTMNADRRASFAEGLYDPAEVLG